MPIDRRDFLKGLFAAPAIVAATSIMPVRALTRLIPVLDPVFVYRQMFDGLIARYPYMDVFVPPPVFKRDAAFSGRLGMMQGVTFIEEVLVPVAYPRSTFPVHQLIRLSTH
jgi:hypothetical protein